MIHLISLNELVLLRFLVLSLLGRPVKLLRVAPFVPKAKNLLQRAVDWAVRTGRAHIRTADRGEEAVGQGLCDGSH